MTAAPIDDGIVPTRPLLRIENRVRRLVKKPILEGKDPDTLREVKWIASTRDSVSVSHTTPGQSHTGVPGVNAVHVQPPPAGGLLHTPLDTHKWHIAPEI